jgi:hypothetical protein
VCPQAGKYLDANDKPCPICSPEYNYSQDDIAKMHGSFQQSDEPNGLPVLTCYGCHDVMSPGLGRPGNGKCKEERNMTKKRLNKIADQMWDAGKDEAKLVAI